MNNNEEFNNIENIKDRIKKVISENKEFSLDVAKLEIESILNKEVDNMRDVDGE